MKPVKSRRSCGKCIRGLLCKSCNHALGYMKDNPDVLRAAADYVEFYRIGKEIQEV